MTSESFTKSQIDKLGERLRKGSPSDSDLVLLDRFRRSYSAGYERVIAIIRDRLGFQPTGRPAKSTSAIVEKLKRESIRLSQVQDIAGCRFIVAAASEQGAALDVLLRELPGASLDDRRGRPSHGYRAVHVIAIADGKPIEIQVRTALQHSWAELSEKYADVIDPAIKYGGGPELVRTLLTRFSDYIADVEDIELQVSEDDLVDVEPLKQEIRGLLQMAVDAASSSQGAT